MYQDLACKSWIITAYPFSYHLVNNVTLASLLKWGHLGFQTDSMLLRVMCCTGKLATITSKIKLCRSQGCPLLLIEIGFCCQCLYSSLWLGISTQEVFADLRWLNWTAVWSSIEALTGQAVQYRTQTRPQQSGLKFNCLYQVVECNTNHCNCLLTPPTKI